MIYTIPTRNFGQADLRICFARERQPKIAEIKEAVAAYYHITVKEMASRRRDREVAWPRQVAMALSVEMTRHTTVTVGRHFGRDHSTVSHACQKVEAREESDAAFGLQLNELRGIVG